MAPTIPMADSASPRSGSTLHLEVQELRLHPVKFTLRLGPAELAALPEVAGELSFVGEARLAGEGMRLRGHLRGEAAPACARCLEPVPTVVERDLDLLYQPEAVIGESAEVEIHAADTEVGFFAGSGLDLADVAREQILLALPMQPLCRADCKGLCPRCGANWNAGPCGCPPVADERWNALKSLRPKA